MTSVASGRVRRALLGDRTVTVTRNVVLDDIRIRPRAAGGDGRTVDAYAAVFMTPAEIVDDDGHYLEQIAPTAFDRTIADRRDEIFCIYNHGRSLGGEASDLWSVPLGVPVTIKPDSKGLFTSTRYNPDEASDRILQAIRSGSLRGMSFTGVFLRSDPEPGMFGYRPLMGGELTLVTRLEIALIEYGPTPIPAYEEATVQSVRSRKRQGRAGDHGAALGYGIGGDPSGPGYIVQDNEGGADVGYRGNVKSVASGGSYELQSQYGQAGRDAALGYGSDNDADDAGFTLQDNEGGADVGYRAGGPVCRTCGGSGRIRAGNVTCPACKGSGKAPGRAGTMDSDNDDDTDAPGERATGPIGYRWDPDNDGDNDAYPGGDTDNDYWSASGQQLKAVPGRPLHGQNADDQTGGHRYGPGPKTGDVGQMVVDPGYGLYSPASPAAPQGSHVLVTGNKGADVGYRDDPTEPEYDYDADDMPQMQPGPHPAFQGTPNSPQRAHPAYPGTQPSPERMGQMMSPTETEDKPGRAGGPSNWPSYPGTPVSGNRDAYTGYGQGSPEGGDVILTSGSGQDADLGYRQQPEYAYGENSTYQSISGAPAGKYPGAGTTQSYPPGRGGAAPEHAEFTGTHSHAHRADDGMHQHPHTHFGDNSHHDHSHANLERAGYLGYGAPEPSGPGGKLVTPSTPNANAGVAVGYHGSGGTPGTNQGDVPFYHGTSPEATPMKNTIQRDKVSPDNIPPGGKPAAKAGDDLYPQGSGSTGRARLPGPAVSRWDAGKVWAAGANSKNPAAFYRAVCAGRRKGDPDKQSSWALPHHNSPDGPPDRGGVIAALGRLNQTEGLINASAARSHLMGHARALGLPSGDESGKKSTSSSGRNPAAESATPRSGAGTGTGMYGTTGPHPHPAMVPANGSEGMNMRIPPVMTVEERRSRLQEVELRLQQIDVEHTGAALPQDVETEWTSLQRERVDHIRNIQAASQRAQYLRQMGSTPQAGYTEGVDGGAVGFPDYASELPDLQTAMPPAYGDGNGGPRTPQVRSNGFGGPGGTLVRNEPVWDLHAIRQRAYSYEDLPRLYRDNAMRALQVSTFPYPRLAREEAQSRVARLLDNVDDEHGTIARRVLVTGSPIYERAFGKMLAKLSTSGLSAEESRALALGTDASGGFAVPFQLDPTVILTSNGVINPLRQISRIEQITGKEWDGVTSLGVTVTRAAEGAEVGSADAAFVQPNVRTTRVMGFVPFNIELDVSWAALRSTMTSLLMDAKDVEEASSFLTGNGTAPAANGLLYSAPGGVPTFGTANANAVTTNSGSASLQIADIYNLENAMPPRFRAQSSFLSSKTIFNTFRQLFQQQAAFAGDAWVHADAGQPARLNGYPAYEASQMPTTLTQNALIFVQGDFQQFLIVDRIGMGIELVPQLFGGTNRYPTGQRGILAIWFNNSKCLVPNAFRALRVGP